MRSAILWLTRAAAVVRRIIGVPDYDTYLAHMHDRHPDVVPLSRDRFTAMQMQARFEKPGARCC
ncbi:MAG TPA: YbdD/YjiX family protein [Gemmatimonadaceae bacterium]|nr:YbdD/YjiX family protein [Gemmatimonadaceae bacterium]